MRWYLAGYTNALSIKLLQKHRLANVDNGNIYSLFRIRMQQISYKRTIQNYTHECIHAHTHKHSKRTNTADIHTERINT